ncbi:helix-turn-helix domain-containing protein [Lactobacillus helveticus]|uniref:helix-turn-helix domain-containing protein n=1 Tax=Lactobacillus helveticus TaxID=1587 RepID=UPI00386F332D
MNRIKQLRNERNLTLVELGEQLNLPKGTLSRYEHGTREPKEPMWQALAKFFNVSVDYLKGYGYSKDYIYKQLDDAYKELWIGKSNLLGVDLIPAFYIEKYCKQNKISIPKDTDLDFWKTNFNFIFNYKEIKRLLTTKDSYTDDEIKEMVTLALFQKTTDKKFVSFIEKVNEQYLKNLQNKTNK